MYISANSDKTALIYDHFKFRVICTFFMSLKNLVATLDKPIAEDAM